MKFILFTIFAIFVGGVPAYSINWEFVTSDRTNDGIEISYFIDKNEIRILNGIRTYKEKRVYTRGKSLKNIGIVQITGYYDCANAYYIKGSISFLSAGDKYLDGYIITGDDYTWKPITQRPNLMMYEYVCRFNEH